MTPFTLHVPDADIADLRERLARTRFPDAAPGEPWAYGTSVDYLRSLVAYWRDGFDWRARRRGSTRFRSSSSSGTTSTCISCTFPARGLTRCRCC